MKTKHFLLAALLGLAGSGWADGVRSLSSVANGNGYARITSVGAGASAEAVDFTDLSDFTSNHRSFTVMVCNENATAANALLVDFVPSGSVAASQLTTPGTDGTVTDVDRIPGSGVTNVPICVTYDIQAVGVILQSVDASNLVDVTVRWTY